MSVTIREPATRYFPVAISVSAATWLVQLPCPQIPSKTDTSNRKRKQHVVKYPIANVVAATATKQAEDGTVVASQGS